MFLFFLVSRVYPNAAQRVYQVDDKSALYAFWPTTSRALPKHGCDCGLLNGFAASGGKPAPANARTHEFFALGKGGRCATRIAVQAVHRAALHVSGPTSRPPAPDLPRTRPCTADRVYGMICVFTVDTHMKAKSNASRIREIVAEMSSITEFALGSTISSSSSYRTKDGVRHRTKPQFKFQSRGRRGEQKLVHIPAGLVPRVRKLIANGRKLESLEREYARLVTEESLAALK